jgi:hypothetical protein
MALAVYEDKKEGAAPVIRQYSDSSFEEAWGDGLDGPICPIWCYIHGPQSCLENNSDKFQLGFNVSGNYLLRGSD